MRSLNTHRMKFITNRITCKMSIISSIMIRMFMSVFFHQPWLAAVPYPCGYVTISGKDWLTSR